MPTIGMFRALEINKRAFLNDMEPEESKRVRGEPLRDYSQQPTVQLIAQIRKISFSKS